MSYIILHKNTHLPSWASFETSIWIFWKKLNGYNETIHTNLIRTVMGQSQKSQTTFHGPQLASMDMLWGMHNDDFKERLPQLWHLANWTMKTRWDDFYNFWWCHTMTIFVGWYKRDKFIFPAHEYQWYFQSFVPINISHFTSIYWDQDKLECAASNGNRYPPYPQVMATAISQ